MNIDRQNNLVLYANIVGKAKFQEKTGGASKNSISYIYDQCYICKKKSEIDDIEKNITKGNQELQWVFFCFREITKLSTSEKEQRKFAFLFNQTLFVMEISIPQCNKALLQIL